MPVVNGIHSPSSVFVASQANPGDGRARNDVPRNEGLAVDIYHGSSETWRNRATATSKEGAACRCGNCPACAAQAYAAQGQGLKTGEQGDFAEPGSVPGQEVSGQQQEEAPASEPKGVDGEVLSQQEQDKLAYLKKTDRAVRAHEQAHLAAAGSLVRRGVSLSYEKGPDGRRYAVAGEVSIDTSKEADPADTISKMRTVRAAALAPAQPSPQDRKVAAAATVTMTNAMTELQLARTAEEKGENVVAGGAAEARAAGDPENGNGSQEGLAEPGAGQSNELSPRRSRAIQRYTASGSAPSKRLTVTA